MQPGKWQDEHRPLVNARGKETRNAGEQPVHGFMGSLLNPMAAVLVLVY